MARTRNEDQYNDARTALLNVGLELMRKRSYDSVGLSDILREAGVPKGSFYHYFSSKEEFGLAVASHYNAMDLESSGEILLAPDRPASERLRNFFQVAYDNYVARGFSEGCLMCNLTAELADREPAFQNVLSHHFQSLSDLIAQCLAGMDLSEIGLSHLNHQEAADWLLNSWAGALTRMKAVRDGAPLQLFMRTTFSEDYSS